MAAMVPDAVTTLLDPTRLMVAGSVVGTGRTTGEIAERTGLDDRAVVEAVGELRRVELVEALADGRYRLDPVVLRGLAASMAEVDVPMDPVIGFGMTDDERGVLERFFHGRTLAEIPANRAKRLVVLERLALEFDVGRHFDEAEVDSILRRFHPDVATLRRNLVDEEFLDRADGEYWRAGGRLG